MSFFLKIGQTIASFRRFGNVPSSRDLLIIITRGLAKRCLNSFRRFVGMEKGPEAFPVLNVPIISVISSGLQGFKNMVFGLGV